MENKIVSFKEPENYIKENFGKELKNIEKVYDKGDNSIKKKMFNILVQQGLDKKIENQILRNRIFELEDKIEDSEKERNISLEEEENLTTTVSTLYKQEIPEKLIQRYKQLNKLVENKKIEYIQHLKNI